MFWDRPWFYLGFTELIYTNLIVAPCTVHFYARGDRWEERKFNYVTKGHKGDIWAAHVFMQQMIIPWSHGHGFMIPIRNPSLRIIEVLETHGWQWDGDHWSRREPQTSQSDNVVPFRRKK